MIRFSYTINLPIKITHEFIHIIICQFFKILIRDLFVKIIILSFPTWVK